jgi:hypothetical protein
MPVRIRTAEQHMAMFSVDADAAQRMIDHSGLQVCRYRPNRAVVVLMLMHYVDGDLGEYLEYGTNVMVNPPGSNASGLGALQSAGAFIHHLPVDQAFTRSRPAARSGATRRSWLTSRFDPRVATSAST